MAQLASIVSGVFSPPERGHFHCKYKLPSAASPSDLQILCNYKI